MHETHLAKPAVARDRDGAVSRLGRVADHRTLVLTHSGRKTGKPHEVTIQFAVKADKVYLSTANIERHWVRNVLKTPHIKLSIGNETFEGEARFLPSREERERALAIIYHKYWMFWPFIALSRLPNALRLTKDKRGAFEVTLKSEG